MAVATYYPALPNIRQTGGQREESACQAVADLVPVGLLRQGNSQRPSKLAMMSSGQADGFRAAVIGGLPQPGNEQARTSSHKPRETPEGGNRWENRVWP